MMAAWGAGASASALEWVRCVNGPLEDSYQNIRLGNEWPYVLYHDDTMYSVVIYEIDVDGPDDELVYRMTRDEVWPRHRRLHEQEAA